MLGMAIDQRWDGRLANNVEASANQREILLGEVDDTRQFWDAAIEPWLDGMAVGRDHVGRLRRHQRTDMVGDEQKSAIGFSGWEPTISQVELLATMAVSAIDAASARHDGRSRTRL